MVAKLVEKVEDELTSEDNLDAKVVEAEKDSVDVKANREQDRHTDENVEEPSPSEGDTDEPENDNATAVDESNMEFREQNEEIVASIENDEVRPRHYMILQ